jgi:mannose-6-phosphate isomerase
MTIPDTPLTFNPILKRIIWGGCRLGTRLNKPIGDLSDCAESWELVDRAADQSVVASGPYAGKTLGELISGNREAVLGKHADLDAFPLLLKYLDCNRVLSVQVHPDDRYAKRMPVPDLGKTEAWYIVEASPNSLIYAGLREGVNREALALAMQHGRTEEVLHSFHPTAGQCVFIPAGTVHALGDGLVVAEVQQSSDTTFRLYDWNRTDANGKTRPLHVDQALEVTNYDLGPIAPQTPVPELSGWQRLVTCEKFELRLGNDEVATLGDLNTGGDDSPVVLMVTQGKISLEGDQWGQASYKTGDTILLPAAAGKARLRLESEDANVLEIRLPT